MLARRFAVVALCAMFLVALFSPASATEWVTKQIGWRSAQPGAGIALASGGLDTCFIGDEADSNRTVVVSTADWDWDALLPAAATSASNPAALVTVTGLRVNAAAESLYVIVEKCWRGVCARSVLAVGTWTTSNITALTPFGMTTAGFGTWSAGSTATVPYTPSSAPVVMFQGRLPIDLDELSSTSSTIFGTPEFRLNLIGDIGGTTPQVNAARLYVTYPKRTQY